MTQPLYVMKSNLASTSALQSKMVDKGKSNLHDKERVKDLNGIQNGLDELHLLVAWLAARTSWVQQ